MSTIFIGTTAMSHKKWHWRTVHDKETYGSHKHKAICGITGYGAGIEALLLEHCKTCEKKRRQILTAEAITKRLLK